MILWSMSGQRSTFDEHATMGQQGEMGTEFLAEKDVSPERAARLMKLAPTNPFWANSYAEAMRAAGHQPWLLGTKREGQIVSGCYGFIASGRLNRVLRLPSVPDVPCDADFWGGLLRFCSRHSVTFLELDSFASTATHIPRLPGEVERQDRCEYVLDLGDRAWERKIAKQHLYSIRRAVQAGITMHKASGADACRAHVRLLAATKERLRKRGVFIPFDAEELCAWFLLLTEKGAGELFQAVAGREVSSSVMILRAAEGVYEETAGTSTEGMRCGASHFLIHSIARVMREESIKVFNLGGAERNAGLTLFKSRFGATPVSLESARFYLGGDFRKKLTDAARFLRQNGTSLLRRVGAVSSL